MQYLLIGARSVRLTLEWKSLDPEVPNAAPAIPVSALETSRDAAVQGGELRIPLCFVIDSDVSVRRFLSLILYGAGLSAKEFTPAKRWSQH